jgi:hypothetical protein
MPKPTDWREQAKKENESLLAKQQADKANLLMMAELLMKTHAPQLQAAAPKPDIVPMAPNLFGSFSANKNKLQVADPVGQAYTTDNVLQLLNTLMHESTHAVDSKLPAIKPIDPPQGNVLLRLVDSLTTGYDREQANKKIASDATTAASKENLYSSFTATPVAELIANVVPHLIAKQANFQFADSPQVEKVLDIPGVREWMQKWKAEIDKKAVSEAGKK